MSQLAKYDLFTDIIFAATAYGCGSKIIGILAATTVAVNIWVILVGFMAALKDHLTKNNDKK